MPRRSRQDGVSLVELMIGMMATVTILGALFAAAIQRSAQRRSDSERNRAFVGAAETLERLRSLPSTQLAPLHGTGFDIPGENGEPRGLTPMPGDADGLPGLIEIAVEDTSGTSTLYRVTVTVTWSGIRRSNRFQLEALIGERL